MQHDVICWRTHHWNTLALPSLLCLACALRAMISNVRPSHRHWKMESNGPVRSSELQMTSHQTGVDTGIWWYIIIWDTNETTFAYMMYQFNVLYVGMSDVGASLLPYSCAIMSNRPASCPIRKCPIKWFTFPKLSFKFLVRMMFSSERFRHISVMFKSFSCVRDYYVWRPHAPCWLLLSWLSSLLLFFEQRVANSYLYLRCISVSILQGFLQWLSLYFLKSIFCIYIYTLFYENCY